MNSAFYMPSFDWKLQCVIKLISGISGRPLTCVGVKYDC